MDIDPANSHGDWARILQAIKTPLAFFALTVLVAEVGLVTFAVKAEGVGVSIAIGGVLLVIILSGAAVYSLTLISTRSTAQESLLRFTKRIEGQWWEEIQHEDGSRLSFFSITANPLDGQLAMVGSSYDKDGDYCANWRSELSRCQVDGQRVSYLWTGRHPGSIQGRFNFHGYGTFDFQPPLDEDGRYLTGQGDFWDVDESTPDHTTRKALRLFRATADETRAMASGRHAEIQAVLQERLKV